MFNTILAIATLILSAGVGLYALFIARGFQKKAPEWIDGFLEDKISLFMTPDPETGQNFVDSLAARFGKGFRMSLLAQKSGEARHQTMIENRVFAAAKERIPELQVGLAALDGLGLGDLATPENLPALYQVARKYGLLDGVFNKKAANRGNGGSTSW